MTLNKETKLKSIRSLDESANLKKKKMKPVLILFEQKFLVKPGFCNCSTFHNHQISYLCISWLGLMTYQPLLFI